MAASTIDYRDIIAFRNILIHAYEQVNDRISGPRES